MYKTYLYQKQLQIYWRFCFEKMLQSWTKDVETKFKFPIKARNWHIFQKPIPPPLPLFQCWFWSVFTLGGSHLFLTTLIWGKRGFYLEKLFFYFVSTILSMIVYFNFFLKNTQLIFWIILKMMILWLLCKIRSTYTKKMTNILISSIKTFVCRVFCIVRLTVNG